MSAKTKTDIALIKALILADFDHFIECMFPARRIQRFAHEYRIGTNGSLSVRREDGAYFDHKTNEGGDIIALIQHTLKTDFKGALVWARAFTGNNSPPVTPLPNTSRKLKKADERALRQREKALAMVRRSRPIKGTLAERYLQEHRGITLEALPDGLRFIEYAYNYTAGAFFPGMIVPMRDVHGEIIAAHVTFLDRATGNKITGEGVKSRLIFGSCRGGAIRLGPVTGRLALCEGIEDALSVMQVCPEWPVWVTGGTSGLRSVELPETVREVLLCGDRDPGGQDAVNAAAERLTREGRKVSISLPPEGFKDFNDALRGVRHDR